MKTYNTYQEAKIANPESNIKTDNLGNFFVSVGYTTCNPADYCMTVEQFLKSGHKFAEGDKYLFSDGYVDTVTVGGDESKIRSGDESRYILRAKALDQPKQDEWKNGDECIYKGDVCYFVGDQPLADSSLNGDCIVQHNGGAPLCVFVNELSKPETPEQKEERERLDSAYDLYDFANNGGALDYDQFRHSTSLDFFLRIVDKTSYRMGKS